MKVRSPTTPEEVSDENGYDLEFNLVWGREAKGSIKALFKLKDFLEVFQPVGVGLLHQVHANEIVDNFSQVARCRGSPSC